MNPYREFTFMHSAYDFLSTVPVRQPVVMDVCDPVTLKQPKIQTVRSAINKIGEAMGAKFRTRTCVDGVLYVTRIY